MLQRLRVKSDDRMGVLSDIMKVITELRLPFKCFKC